MSEEIFSPIENKVLRLLGRKAMTISKLTEAYFAEPAEGEVINPNAVVSAAVIRINRKCKYHKLHWFLNSMGTGRAGKTVWKDKRVL